MNVKKGHITCANYDGHVTTGDSPPLTPLFSGAVTTTSQLTLVTATSAKLRSLASQMRALLIQVAPICLATRLLGARIRLAVADFLETRVLKDLQRWPEGVLEKVHVNFLKARG